MNCQRESYRGNMTTKSFRKKGGDRDRTSVATTSCLYYPLIPLCLLPKPPLLPLKRSPVRSCALFGLHAVANELLFAQTDIPSVPLPAPSWTHAATPDGSTIIRMYAESPLASLAALDDVVARPASSLSPHFGSTRLCCVSLDARQSPLPPLTSTRPLPPSSRRSSNSSSPRLPMERTSSSSAKRVTSSSRRASRVSTTRSRVPPRVSDPQKNLCLLTSSLTFVFAPRQVSLTLPPSRSTT